MGTTANTLQLLFKNGLTSSEFPKNLILVDARLVFKEKDPLEKTNYQHVSVLPTVLTEKNRKDLTEKNKQTYKNYSYPYLFGNRKGFRR